MMDEIENDSEHDSSADDGIDNKVAEAERWHHELEQAGWVWRGDDQISDKFLRAPNPIDPLETGQCSTAFSLALSRRHSVENLGIVEEYFGAKNR
jgi:hypothetical protein